MKKILISAILFLVWLNVACAQTTPNIGFNVPPAGTLNWSIPLNANMNLLDSLMSGATYNANITWQYKPVFVNGVPSNTLCYVNGTPVNGIMAYNYSTTPWTPYVCYSGVMTTFGSSGGGLPAGVTSPGTGSLTGTSSLIWPFVNNQNFIPPSGDTTCATDTTNIQAAITAAQTSGNPIKLESGNYYINALTIGAPITLQGVGAGTIINDCTATGNAFTLAYNTSSGGNSFAKSQAWITDFTLQMKSGVTPTAGYGFALSNGGSGYMSNLHLERISIQGMWEPIYLGTGLITNFFTKLNISNCLSGIGMEFNTPPPGGDLFPTDITMTSSSSSQACSVQIDQSDTTEFTNLKLNGGAGIVFTRASTTQRIRFIGGSLEGTNTTGGLPNCMVQFGTAGSNTPFAISFVGTTIGVSPYAFCAGANTSTTTDVPFTYSGGSIYTGAFGAIPNFATALAYNSIFPVYASDLDVGNQAIANSVLIPNNASGVLKIGTLTTPGLSGTQVVIAGSGGGNIEFGTTTGGGRLGAASGLVALQSYSGTLGSETATNILTNDTNGTGIGMASGSNSDTLYVIPGSTNVVTVNGGAGNAAIAETISASGPISAPYYYAQFLIDGTKGGTNTGSTSSAGAAFCSAVTGTKDCMTILKGTGVADEKLRIYDVTGAHEVMDFLPSGYTQTFAPPLYSMGTAIASAATIAPTAPAFHVTGTTQINTITAPTGCTTSSTMCQIIIIPDGLWSTGTTGNIAIATTAVVSKALVMIYDPATLKWYPSY